MKPSHAARLRGSGDGFFGIYDGDKKLMKKYVYLYYASFVVLVADCAVLFAAVGGRGAAPWITAGILTVIFAAAFAVGSKKIKTGKEYNAAQAYLFYKKCRRIFKDKMPDEKGLKSVANKCAPDVSRNVLAEMYKYGKSICEKKGEK